jgi:hypothetical protein
MIAPRALRLLSFMAFGLLAACANAPGPNGPPPGTPQDVAQLAQAIQQLGPDVDPKEAQRAAQVTYDYTHQLAQDYQITDPPLIHNTKVNLGTKPRGLCWHWARDIDRAVANHDNLLLEHSTAIISAKGDALHDGIILDPWRKGGVLFWSPVREDKRYDWYSRDQVLAEKLGHDQSVRFLTYEPELETVK